MYCWRGIAMPYSTTPHMIKMLTYPKVSRDNKLATSIGFRFLIISSAASIVVIDTTIPNKFSDDSDQN